MNSLIVAFRYLVICRRDGRSFFKTVWPVLSIGLSIATLVVVLSVMVGFKDMFTKKLIGIGGEVSVEGFLDQRDDLATLALIEDAVGTRNVSPVIEAQVVLSIDREVMMVTAVGVMPDREMAFTRLPALVSTGSFTLDGGHIVIGREIASRYGVKIGDDVRLIAPFTRESIRLAVSGVLDTGLYHVDASTVMLDMDTARSFFAPPTLFTSFKVNPDGPFAHRFDLKVYLLTHLAPFYRVLTWDESNRSVLEALHLERVMMMMVLAMMVLLSGFNMSSTLTILTTEKRYDIGVLKTIGFSIREIMWIFLLKAMSWFVCGAVLGVSLGILIARNIHAIFMGIERIIGVNLVTGSSLYFKEFPVSIYPMDVGMIVGFSFVITMISALGPSSRASRQDAVEILKS